MDPDQHIFKNLDANLKLCISHFKKKNSKFKIVLRCVTSILFISCAVILLTLPQVSFAHGMDRSSFEFFGDIHTEKEYQRGQ